MKVLVIASWENECFCPRPRLRIEELCVDYDPIFRFKEAARKLAAFNGCTQLSFSKTDKQAWTKGNFSCHHYPNGVGVRIDWKLPCVKGQPY